jgi:hypothetical protein
VRELEELTPKVDAYANTFQLRKSAEAMLNKYHPGVAFVAKTQERRDFVAISYTPSFGVPTSSGTSPVVSAGMVTAADEAAEP